MKTFLKVFITIVILGFVALLVVGGSCCFCYDSFNKEITDTNITTMEQKAKTIASYKLPPDFSLAKAINFDIIGFKMAIFDNKKEPQFLVIAQPGIFMNLTEQNLQTELNQENIQKALSSGQQKDTEIRNFKIINQGMIPISTKKVPYIHATADVYVNSTNTTVPFEGAIAVISEKNKNTLILFGSPPNTFNLDVMKEFSKTVAIN